MRTNLLLAVVLACAGTAYADTIKIKQSRTQDARILAKDVIVVYHDKPTDSPGGAGGVTYYYWHVRKQDLEKARYNYSRDETVSVEYSDAEARKDLIARILAGAVRAEVTDVRGGAQEIFCLRARPLPPKGYMYLGHLPDDTPTLKLEGTQGVLELNFAALRSVEFKGKNAVEVVTNEGKTVSGEWKGRYKLFGLTDKGEMTYVESEDLARITFVGKNSRR